MAFGSWLKWIFGKAKALITKYAPILKSVFGAVAPVLGQLGGVLDGTADSVLSKIGSAGMGGSRIVDRVISLGDNGSSNLSSRGVSTIPGAHGGGIRRLSPWLRQWSRVRDTKFRLRQITFILYQMSSNVIEPIQTYLNIIESTQRCIETFNTYEEFGTWHFKHKQRVDSQTTHILNWMYSMPGYRITKIKGVLSLKRTHEKATGIKDPVMNEKVSASESEQIQASTERISRLETSCDQIVDILNSQRL